jgi:hypothetical protein
MSTDSFDISIHHVGGRAGTMQFPYLPELFEKELLRVLYDADESCIENIEKLHSEGKSKRVILPYCISDHTGKENFHLMPDRYGSSLLPPEYIEPETYFVENLQFGWELDMHNPDEVLELEVTTLDELFINQSSKTDASPPDFLSLDVENAEPKVLNGAKGLLYSHVLSFQCEFGMHTTFNRIMDISKENQFKLVDIELASYDYSFKYNRQLPIGLRAEKGNIPDYGEIFFLKQPEAIIANHDNPLLDLLKAAFISFIHFKLPDMYSYLEKWVVLEDSSDFLKENHSKKNYLTFLMNFMKTLKTYPEIYPVRFSTMFPTAESRSNRFSNKPIMLSPHELRKKYFEQVDVNVFKKNIPVMFKNNYIGIEGLCISNGFKEHADVIRKKRVTSLVNLLNRLDLLDTADNTYTIKAEFQYL